MANKFLLYVGLSLSLLCCGCAGLRPPAADVAPAPPGSLRVGETNIVAMSVPAASRGPQQTLPQFLGLDKACGAFGGGLNRIFSRIKTSLGLVGKFPGLQPKPPVVPITDPANLEEGASPAVQTAAKVKADEDQADQKIQALRYLATIGCGACYPEVEDALLAALDDCTESVRYAAIRSLRGQSGKACERCCSGGCCSAKVQKKLNQMIHDVDKTGRRIETSERILRQARLILQACGPPIVADESTSPEEGPSAKPKEAKAKSPALADGTSEAAVQTVGYDEESPAFADPFLNVGFVDGHPIQARELNQSIRNQLEELGKDRLDEMSSSVREAIIQTALTDAVDQQLIHAAFLQARQHAGSWDPAQAEDPEQWFATQVDHAADITENQILEYYQQHADEFKIPASVKWEKASANVEQPSQFAATFKSLEYMQSVANGTPVSKPKDKAAVTVNVESFDWTLVEDIEEAAIARTLQTTPAGKTSQVIRNGNQLMLVRVLSRRDDSQLPLEQARDKIRTRLVEQQQQAARQRWLQQARSRASIWTVFDPKPPQTAQAEPTHDQPPVAATSQLPPGTTPAQATPISSIDPDTASGNGQVGPASFEVEAKPSRWQPPPSPSQKPLSATRISTPRTSWR